MTVVRILPLAALALALGGCAVANGQPSAQDHSAHTSAGAAGSAHPPAARELQMKKMQEMRQRMQAARTPQERAALMDEHMKLMQQGAQMMGGAHGSAPAAVPPAPGAPGGGMGGGMMGMHKSMEDRMAMMEAMMQMMVDRQAR